MWGRLIRWGLPLALLAAVGVGAAMAAAASMHSGAGGTVKATHSGKYGTILVASNGRTLYRFTSDGKDVNRCSSVPVCAKSWPALLVKAGAKPTAGTGVRAAMLGTMKAAHGMRQVTYGSFPLYLFAGDKSVGQTNGEGTGGKWFVISPSGALVKHAITTSSTPATTTTSSSGGGGGWG
jgi:predicted lipoprotein with Yx(FWY)xxD motif